MLTREDIEHFKTKGYVVKRGVLQPALMDWAIDRVWRELPPWFRQDAPETWQGVVEDSCKSASVEQRLGHLKFRECLRDERPLLNLSSDDPNVRRCVQQLLGEGKALPNGRGSARIRGLYLVLPSLAAGRFVAKPHFDRHVFQVGMVGYLSHVSADGGAFSVWPGSHIWVAERIGVQVGLIPSADRDRVIAEYTRQPPVPCVPIAGDAGDVIFYHHRLLHAAGPNRTKFIRYAVFVDFARPDVLRARSLVRQKSIWSGWAV